MSVMLLLASLSIMLAFRLYLFRQFKKLNPEGDEISHLLMLKTIQQNNNQIPETIPQFILNYNDYPNGFHKLIALLGLPTRFWEKNGGFVPIVCDVLLLLWIAGFSLLTGGQDLTWLLLFPAIRLLWSREARSNDFGERAFGVLTGNLYLGSVYLYSLSGSMNWLVVAVISFAAASCSSKFSNQAMLFFSLLMTLYTQDWRYLAVYLGSLLIAALLTRGYVLKVLRGQILYSVYYRKYRMARTLYRNFYRDCLGAFKRFKLSRFGFFFFENPLFMLISNCPANLAFLLIWLMNGFAWTDLTAYALIGSLLGLIIASEPLKYLGQPERYLEFSLPPLFAALSRYAVADYWMVFTASLSVGLVAMFYHVTVQMRQQSTGVSRRDSYRQLKRFLARQPSSTILTIPLKCANNLAYLLNKKHSYVANFTHCRTRSQYQAYESLMPDYYPFPASDLKPYIQQYGIDLLVYLKSSEDHLNKMMGGGYYQFSDYQMLYENDEFMVFRT